MLDKPEQERVNFTEHGEEAMSIRHAVDRRGSLDLHATMRQRVQPRFHPFSVCAGSDGPKVATVPPYLLAPEYLALTRIKVRCVLSARAIFDLNFVLIRDQATEEPPGRAPVVRIAALGSQSRKKVVIGPRGDVFRPAGTAHALRRKLWGSS